MQFPESSQPPEQGSPSPSSIPGVPPSTARSEPWDHAPSLEAPNDTVSAAFPSFIVPAEQGDSDSAKTLRELTPGCRLGDFELLRPLGAGAFGRVFLAKQHSLGRLVALKITVEEGNEARTLAILEHDYIVRVFAEETHYATGLNLVSMQYVPGCTLEQVAEAAVRVEPAMRSGQLLLDVCQAENTATTSVDEAGLRDRELIANFDYIEAICWMGAKLCEGLEHAHSQGVLHRDIKPSNILLNRNCRPLISDFGLATSLHRERLRGTELFGGTLAYMAPEHLDAFNPAHPTQPEAVDHRSDLYSLGIVLFELLTGQLPFPRVVDRTDSEELRTTAEKRRGEPPSARQFNPLIPPVLDRIIRRTLNADPALRYQSGAELAAVLDGTRELRGLDRAVPPQHWLTRFSLRQPQLVSGTLPLLPHLLGALVVLLYTQFWVASHPLKSQLNEVFGLLSLGYSLIVFPLTGTIAFLLTRPIWAMWLKLQDGSYIDPILVNQVRQRALRKPYWGAWLSLLGWLPGAVLLPLLLIWWVPAASTLEVFLNYALSFTIAGLIALTYTEFVDQFLLLSVAYRVLWADPVRPRLTARKELAVVEKRLQLFQVLSGLIPLSASFALMIALIFTNPEQRSSPSYQTFLVLVALLVGLGMAGSWLAVIISGRLKRVLQALTSTSANISQT